MTEEEAIKELREASDSEVRYGDTERHYNEVMKRVEAFDMAIKALEEVSRLPENLHREREQAYMNGYADGKSTCRWISVDDKLPEENQRVLVIYRSLISDTEKMDIDFIKGKYWQNHGGVIAWMPLPEWEGMEYDEECKTMKIKKSAYDDAIERIDKSTFTLHDGLDCVETLVAFEAVMIASRQTKPCEEQYSVDCVSRDAVLKLADYFGKSATYDNPMPDGIMAVPVDKIEELPSVIPTNPSTTPSVGVWIDQGFYADNSSTHDFMCSVCGNHEIEVEMDHFKYCPVCGARLEVEE